MTHSAAWKSAGLTVLSLVFGLALMSPAQALSMKECGAKYQAAKAGGTLKGMKWNDFRKAQCGDEDVSQDDAAAQPAAAPVPAPAGSTVKTGRVVFPKNVSPKYADEAPGRARLLTCVDQYNANKASGGNGTLKWIEKGGGYFSQCNKRLKGQAPA
jgi:hypothetical protein